MNLFPPELHDKMITMALAGAAAGLVIFAWNTGRRLKPIARIKPLPMTFRQKLRIAIALSLRKTAGSLRKMIND